MRLKRWESPRREGRNNKGKGGSARQRQLKKQQQMLRKKLKGEGTNKNQQNRGGEINFSPFFFCLDHVRLKNCHYERGNPKTLTIASFH